MEDKQREYYRKMKESGTTYSPKGDVDYDPTKVMDPNSVVLVSGGLDSFICWYLFCPGATPVFVDIGQNYIEKERTAVKNIANTINAIYKNNPTVILTGPTEKTIYPKNFTLIEHKGSQIGRFENKKSGIIPSRNAELILCGSNYGEDIYFGVIKDEINSDKSPEFITAMEQVLNISNKKQYWTDGTTFSIKTPTAKYNKTELIKMYLDKGGSVEHLNLTVSCYSPTDFHFPTILHCGSCPSCFKRYVGFKNNGLSFETLNDPVEYAKKNGIIDKCNDGTYPEGRSKEILKALES
jgi:7-cyano-7-deazaguanine synthase in queuosine biosynthesis